MISQSSDGLTSWDAGAAADVISLSKDSSSCARGAQPRAQRFQGVGAWLKSQKNATAASVVGYVPRFEVAVHNAEDVHPEQGLAGLLPFTRRRHALPAFQVVSDRGKDQRKPPQR